VAPSEIAHGNLGIALAQIGTPEDLNEAVLHLEAALRMDPNLVRVRHSLGNALARLGRFEEAVEQYEAALRLQPEQDGIRNNLGNALAALGRFDEAVEQYQEVLRRRPDHTTALNNLAKAYEKAGRHDEAIEQYSHLLRLRPDDAGPHGSLALIFDARGETAQVIHHYREVLRINPRDLKTQNNLAWILATHPNAKFRDGAEAVRLAESVCEATHEGVSPFLDTLAAAYAEGGRFDDAVRTAEQAARLAREAGLVPAALGIEERLDLYREAKPFRDVAKEE